MQVHIDRGGKRFGPYSIEQVNARLADGSILPTDLGKTDVMASWVPITKFSSVTTADAAVPPPADTGSTCPKCQAKVTAGQRVCTGCGINLQSGETPVVQTTAKPAGSKNLLVGIGAGVGALAIAATVGFFLQKGNDIGVTQKTEVDGDDLAMGPNGGEDGDLDGGASKKSKQPPIDPNAYAGNRQLWTYGGGRADIQKIYIGKDAAILPKAFGKPASWKKQGDYLIYTYDKMRVNGPQNRQYSKVHFVVKPDSVQGGGRVMQVQLDPASGKQVPQVGFGGNGRPQGGTYPNAGLPPGGGNFGGQGGGRPPQGGFAGNGRPQGGAYPNAGLPPGGGGFGGQGGRPPQGGFGGNGRPQGGIYPNTGRPPGSGSFGGQGGRPQGGFAGKGRPQSGAKKSGKGNSKKGGKGSAKKGGKGNSKKGGKSRPKPR